MEYNVRFNKRPRLLKPIMILGFGGWSNAGNSALKSIDYIIEKKGGKLLGKINPDNLYQFTQNRPAIAIEEGRLKSVSQTEMPIYYMKNKEGEHDIIFIRGQEPDYRWNSFVDTIIALCKKWDVSVISSLGGMYDDILHTEAIVSGVYSSEEWRDIFIKNDINMINYEGPSGIHSLIMEKSKEHSYPFFGIWGHTPLYLRGTNFRVVIRIVELLAFLFSFSIETSELEVSLKEFETQIQGILDQNDELKEHIEQIKKMRAGENRKKGTPKVVNIKDFIRPNES